MAHEVGQVIAGPPEDENVNKWKEFLKRPENLATALVLATAVTSPKSRGQTDLNKVLASGTAALGFRGGLEAGVAGQRAGKREEARTVQEQEADIAAQAAATAQGKRRNEISQQQVTQQGQARPLAPSDIALNQAQAGLATAQAGALGAASELSLSFPQLLATNLQAAREASVDGTVDENAIALQTLRQQEFNKLAEMGALTSQTDPDTGEEILGIDTAMIPPDRLAEFERLLPQPSPEDTTGVGDDAATTVIKDSLRVSGRLKATPAAQAATIRILRKNGELDELSDERLLDRVEEVRKLAQDQDGLKSASIESLEDMLTVFEKVLSRQEARDVRTAVRQRTGVAQRNVSKFETRF